MSTLHDAARQTIENDITNNKIMIYMKGTPDAPQCGFSSQVAQIFQSLQVPFASKNILEDMELREGIKEFSDWPTIPQVYVNGEFVGGCDIVTELYQKGELQKIIAS